MPKVVYFMNVHENFGRFTKWGSDSAIFYPLSFDFLLLKNHWSKVYHEKSYFVMILAHYHEADWLQWITVSSLLPFWQSTFRLFNQFYSITKNFVSSDYIFTTTKKKTRKTNIVQETNLFSICQQFFLNHYQLYQVAIQIVSIT